jgi:catechol 2,3-dioxygenase-like lactoylglutathione lyase family enzyme
MHLHAFALVVPDYDEAIALYVDVLGFDLLEDSDQGNDNRWVMVAPRGPEGCRILLAKAVNDRQRAAIGSQTGGRVGFFLHTETFEADYARFREAGVHFEEDPRREPYGSVAVFRDPFGNRWDLLQLAK